MFRNDTTGTQSLTTLISLAVLAAFVASIL